MITIISDDKKQSTGKRVFELMKSKGIDVEYISTVGLNVKPCYSCGGCSTKTHGKCVINDDMDAILRKLIRTDKLVLISPVTWGSYSSDIKKVFDRSSILGDAYYYAKKGELVKGMRSNIKQLFAIGVKANCREEEKEVFHKLIYENVKIMNISGNSFIVEQESEILPVVEEICR